MIQTSGASKAVKWENEDFDGRLSRCETRAGGFRLAKLLH